MGFHSAIAVALASARHVAGLTVSYHRDSRSVELTVAAGRPTDVLNEYGEVTMAAAERDWLIAAADLVLDGDELIPRPGDEIRETVGLATYCWEVLPIDGETCWTWSDPGRTTRRVHTKRVGQ